MKKLILLFIICVSLVSFVGCRKEEPYQNESDIFKSQFDLTEEKEIWDGTINGEYSIDRIIITLKKTNSYPMIELEYIGIDNLIGFKYVNGPRPPENYFEEENKNLLEDFRQVIIVYFDSKSKQEIICFLRELEKIDFIKSARLYEVS